MGFEYIKRAICDKCGKECNYISESTSNKKGCSDLNLREEEKFEKIYSYVQVNMRGINDRLGRGKETIIVLCKQCANDLKKWATPKKR